jgi:tetratricopeptide (TPR) repeat protein
LSRALFTARSTSAGGGADTTTAVERATERMKTERDASLRREVLLDGGKALGAIGDYPRARAAFAEAEALAVGDDRSLRTIAMARADMATLAGDYADAAMLLERIEPVLARTPSEGPTYYALLVNLALSVAGVGAVGARDRALEYLRLAEVEANRRQDSPAQKVDREKTRGLLYMLVGEWRAGAESCVKSADLAREYGFLYDTAVSLHNLAESRIRLGEHAQAYAVAQQSLALADEGTFEILANANRVLIAYLDGLNGDDRATDTLMEQVNWAVARGLGSDEMLNRYWLGLLLLARRQLAQAGPHLERAKVLAQQLGNRQCVQDCEEALAKVRRGG